MTICKRGVILSSFLLFMVLCVIQSMAQSSTTKKRGEFYFSWGYNSEAYTRSKVKISQPELDDSAKVELLHELQRVKVLKRSPLVEHIRAAYQTMLQVG